jgi:chromosome segregation ATPase
MSSEISNLFDGDDAEFEQAIVDIEQSLSTLKQRYYQVKQDLQQQAELKGQFESLEQEWQIHQQPELEKELINLRDQIQELSVALESALLSSRDFQRLFWKGIRQGLLSEVFWQIIRFGGLGIVIGWLLKTYAG